MLISHYFHFFRAASLWEVQNRFYKFERSFNSMAWGRKICGNNSCLVMSHQNRSNTLSPPLSSALGDLNFQQGSQEEFGLWITSEEADLFKQNAAEHSVQEWPGKAGSSGLSTALGAHRNYLVNKSGSLNFSKWMPLMGDVSCGLTSWSCLIKGEWSCLRNVYFVTNPSGSGENCLPFLLIGQRVSFFFFPLS